MKTKVLFGMLFLVLPLNLLAQVDDAYFVPSKAKKKAAKERYQRDLEERAELQQLEYDRLVRMANQIADGEFYEDEFDGEAPDYHIGALRNEDEYNRRGVKNYATLVNGKDTIYYDEEEMEREAAARQQARDRNTDIYAYDDVDYDYASRLVRFHGGLSSRYYWDYNYDWAYDPYYRLGWTYDPWYWDYYGPGWYYPRPYYSVWGWNHGGWYSGWYGGYYGYYDPWYHGYYYGPGYWPGGGYIGHSYGRNTSGSRRGSSLAGLSASRGSRGGSLSGSTRGMSSSRAGSSASRGNGYRIDGLSQQRNDGRITTGRTTTGNRTATTSSRTATTTQRSTANTTTSRSNTSTTTSRTQSYTPTTTTSSSRGGGFSSSSSSSGGGFSSSSSSAGRSSGGGGGGRGGR